MDLAGAGGKWKTIEESKDATVVKQMSDVSCGAACGEMLLLDRGVSISQVFIAALTGIPLRSILRMKVQLLTINTTETPRVFRVELLVGSQPLRFNVTVEIDTLANQTILITHGSQEFSEFFRFNQDLASKISKFVCSFSESIPIHFPIYIGDFLPLNQSELLENLTR